MHRVAYCAKLVHTFWPLMTQLSPCVHGAGRQRREVTARAGFGEALAPRLLTRQQPRHHLGGEFRPRVVDHRRRQHVEHRVRPGIVEPASDDLLADDGAQDHPGRPARPPTPASRTASSPRRTAPSARASAALDARRANGRRRRSQVVARRAMPAVPCGTRRARRASVIALPEPLRRRHRARAFRSRAGGPSRGRRCVE